MIACVGLYGTVSYTVARRTGEIGIRMALGAQRLGVVWMVLREVLGLAAFGLAIGVAHSAGHVEVRRIILVRNEAQRSPGAYGGCGNTPGSSTSGRVRACTEGVSNRPDDCRTARVRRVASFLPVLEVSETLWSTSRAIKL